MQIKSLNELTGIALHKGVKKCVVAVAQDEDVLKAIKQAAKDGIIIPILVGDPSKIRAAAIEAEMEISAIEIIAEPDDSLACIQAVKMIKEGKASLLMKGMVNTGTLLKAVIDKEKGLLKSRLLSHIAFFESPYYHKILCVTDAAMNIAPDINEKVAILKNAVDAFHKLGVQKPKAGILAAVETVNPKMEATIHASMLTTMYQRGQINGCIVDGPFALDNAVSKEAATHKGIMSEVAGDADILLVPEINSGNILYKSLNFLGGAVTAAVITGAMVPIVLTSRADSDKSKYLSIALACVLE